MSIIYDALNKAEAAESKTGENNKPACGSIKKTKFVYICIIAVLVLSCAAGAYYFNRKSIHRTLSSFLSKSGGKPADKFKNPLNKFMQMPRKIYLPNSYVLEGVICGQDSPTAIINGKVLKLQDKIDNFQVISITPTTAELLNLNDNTTKTLSF